MYYVLKYVPKKILDSEVLPEEETWSLFEKMAGECVNDPNAQQLR